MSTNNRPHKKNLTAYNKACKVRQQQRRRNKNLASQPKQSDIRTVDFDDVMSRNAWGKMGIQIKEKRHHVYDLK